MRKRLMVFGVLCLVVSVALTVASCSKSRGRPIKIGAVLVLTGPDARAGQSAKHGVELAVADLNRAGGIHGRQIEVIYEDDEGDSQKAVSAVSKLINVDKVPAIVGPMWSSPVLAVAPIVERKHVVLLSPTASSPKITSAGDFVFRNTYSDAFEGSKTAEYSYRKLGRRNMGVLYINNDFGEGLKDAFTKRFVALGGKIAISESYDPESASFRAQLVKCKQASPDALYLVGYSEVGQVLKQAKELGVQVPVVSTIMFEISDVARIAGSAAEGVVYAYVSYDPQVGDRAGQEFTRKFRAKYGSLPDPEAAFAYDALMILANAMSKNGLDPAEIRTGLYQTRDYDGVTGRTTFDKNGDVSKPIGFKKVRNGKYIWEAFRY